MLVLESARGWFLDPSAATCTLSPCKFTLKIDIAVVSPRRLFCYCKLRYKINFLDHPSQTGPGLGPGCDPKTVLAITCTICLHFQIRDRGSARFFGAHLFGFWSRGPIFGPRSQHFDKGFRNLARAGPGRFWRQKWGLEKHGFAREWFRKWGSWDFP